MNQQDAVEKLGFYIRANFKSQSDYAKSMSFTKAFVTMVLNGDREPTNFMLHDIGVKKTKTTVYSIIKDKGSSK